VGGIGEWVVKSFVIAVGLLLAVYVIASRSTPDPTPLEIAGVTERLGSGTSARSPFATRWCSRCTPSRAWPGYRRLVDAARGGATQRGLEGGPRLGGNTGDLVRHPRHPLSDHA
jgi:hypothetical protein